MESTFINPQFLLDNNYEFETDLESSLRLWRDTSPGRRVGLISRRLTSDVLWWAAGSELSLFAKRPERGKRPPAAAVILG